MSLYDKMNLGFGSGFGAGTNKLFNLKPTDGSGDFNVDRADTDATELVTNGSFATDTDWTKGWGWSIGSGVATSTGAIGALEQTLVVTEDEEYYLEVTTSGGSYNSGGLKIRLGGSNNLAQITQDGTYLFKLTCEASTNLSFVVDVMNAFSGSIDNVSVKSAAFKYAATIINKDGLIEGVRPNVPRASFPIGGSTNGCPFLVVEPDVTNHLVESEELDGAQWTKSEATVTVNATTAPDGTLTADKLVEAATSNFHSIRQYESAITDAVPNTLSAFFKAAERDEFELNFHGGYAIFNLTSATIETEVSIDEARIEDYGNGWYRCSITKVATNAFTNNYIYLSNGTSRNYLGDGVSGLYIWGAMLEVADSPSYYVPTTTAEVTKQADEINGAGDGSDFNDEGVLWVHISALRDSLTEREITINSGNSTWRVGIKYNAVTNQIEAFNVNNSIEQVTIAHTLSDETEFTLAAFRFKQNDFSFWVSGGEVGSSSVGDISSGKFTTASFDNGSGGNLFEGKCFSFAYFGEYLTDEEMQYLTLENNFEFESGDAYIFN